ncbi:hypothetical protein, partial [Burkholderia ubonensis]|uniref:hypothetical protein n=1 Tax=Burkholderia ubonensis TaxID=101571 RepID=UPI001E60ABB1
MASKLPDLSGVPSCLSGGFLMEEDGRFVFRRGLFINASMIGGRIPCLEIDPSTRVAATRGNHSPRRPPAG